MSIKLLADDGLRALRPQSNALTVGSLREAERKNRVVTVRKAAANLKVPLSNIRKRSLSHDAPFDEFSVGDGCSLEESSADLSDE